MPTYLCHGFRWQRQLIRIFVIVEDLEDAAPDWIIARNSSRALLERFAAKFDFLPPRPQSPAPPEAEQQGAAAQRKDDDASASATDDGAPAGGWSPVKLLEEYDPSDTAVSTGPYAYVADYAVRVDLSASLEEEMLKYEEAAKSGGGAWLERLRDELQAGERIGWYVVVCGDEERYVPREGEEEGGVESEGEEGELEAKGLPGKRTHSLTHRMSSVALRRLFKKKEP